MAKVIGALWVRESRDGGRRYFSGQLDFGALGTVKIAIFRNERREHDKQPDYNIVLSAPMALPPAETVAVQHVDVQAEEPDDDIPF